MIVFSLPVQTFCAENLIHVIQLDDVTINPITSEYISTAIDKAAQENAQCLIIELDTPGGLLTSTRTIVKKILSSQIPVVVYISPGGSRAGSAGVFITYASHVAAMARSTNIGAAHPVSLDGKNKKDGGNFWDALRDYLDRERKQSKETSKSQDTLKDASTKKADKAQDAAKNAPKEEVAPQKTDTESADEDPMKDKILNDTVAFIKSIAAERKRNIDWAVESVAKSQSITESEALEKGVIEIIAENRDELITKLDGRSVTVGGKEIILQTKGALVKAIPMNFRQRFFNILANPNIAYIFFILGFYGLLYEVTHPGAALPGVLGTIFLVLAFYSMQLLPTNYAGLTLIILAIILFVAEAKAPGFGLFTLGGVVCMFLGSLMLFDSTIPAMRVSLSIVSALTLTTAAITMFLVRLVIRTHKRKVISGKEGLIGEAGTVASHISAGKDGKVFVHGEWWDATADDDIKKDERVVIIAVDGMKLKVKRA